MTLRLNAGATRSSVAPHQGPLVQKAKELAAAAGVGKILLVDPEGIAVAGENRPL